MFALGWLLKTILVYYKKKLQKGKQLQKPSKDNVKSGNNMVIFLCGETIKFARIQCQVNFSAVQVLLSFFSLLIQNYDHVIF